MCAETAESGGSGEGRSQGRPRSTVGLTLSMDRSVAEALVEEVRRAVRDAVREEMSARVVSPPPDREAHGPAAPAPTERGFELRPEEPLKARDLRTALLLGKIPEDAGLLIDAATMAGLMSVSRRTLERLVAGGAVPAPVRLTGRLNRWRLGEFLEWIEAGCPHTRHWTYAPIQGRQGKPRK